MKANTYLLYGVQIVSKIGFLAIGLLMNRWIITYLSLEEYAIYNVVNDSLLPFMTVLLTLALSSIIQKQYTNTEFNSETRQSFANMWTTFFVMRLMTFGLGVGILTLLNEIFSFADIRIILLLFTTQSIILFDWNYRAVCDALGRTWMFNLTDIATKAVTLAVLYGLIWSGIIPSILLYGSIMIGGVLLNVGLDMYFHKTYTPWGKFDMTIILENIQPMITLSLTGIITYFYLFSFQLNLQFWGVNSTDINTFSNAYNRLFLTFVSIPAIIMPNIATRLTQLLKKGQYKQSQKLYLTVLALSIIYGLLYYITVPIVLNILDPNQLYPEVINLVRILSFGIVLYPSIHLFGPLFIFFHKEKYELGVATILAIIGMSLQFILIPQWGIQGLIYGILITISIDFLLKLTLFARIIQGLLHKNP
jgi:O-antigen/teichoic acid export membrane protein